MAINCSIGIMAHNEEANIGRLLNAVVSQKLKKVAISEIVVVASGCTDNTENIVRDWAKLDSRIRLISQEKRAGKATAINEYLPQACERVLVLCSADLIPESDAIERLIAPFVDPEVGMTSSRPVPVNDPSCFMGFAAHMLWSLHHAINLTNFKAGEMLGVRKIFERIPYHTAVDEASMEPVVRGQGYRAEYVPTAVVYNKGPETVADFLRQRRRIYAGHLAVRDTLGYTVSTMSALKVFMTLLRHLDFHPRSFVWTWAVVGLEAYGRFLGLRDYRRRRDHRVWEIAQSTKQLNMLAKSSEAAAIADTIKGIS